MFNISGSKDVATTWKVQSSNERNQLIPAADGQTYLRYDFSTDRTPILLRRDFEFHRAYWKLSGNVFLSDLLERLMAPLFAFVVLASGLPTTGAMGREHYVLVDALRTLQEPEFTDVVRRVLTGFAVRWVSATAPDQPLKTEAAV